ncbi:MAG: hypothetical protein Q8K00_12825 [Syntrophales bacterium]|nr:hypothetical protein [Syntrophales bacterium]
MKALLGALFRKLLLYLLRFLEPSNLIQLILIGLVTWYAIETHKLQVVSDRQLNLLERQHAIQSTPVLQILFKPEDPQITQQIVQKASSRHDIRTPDNSTLWTPILISHTDQIARDITTVWFNKVTQSYIWSGGYMPVFSKYTQVMGKNQLSLGTIGVPVTAEFLRKYLSDLYNGCSRCIDDSIDNTSESFVAVYYVDSLGTPYVLKQPYAIGSVGIINFISFYRDLSHDPRDDHDVKPNTPASANAR